ncbi:MAG: hypothetical protein ACRDOL_45035, partial [Streptosporangiaceae bacterium]
PSRAGPNRLSTTTAGPDPRKQNLIGNTHRLDTEDHFRTDVSYLPDLQAYLDDLLRNRERLLAATDIEEWARAEAMPSEEEIRRIRRLISRIKADLGNLPAEDRAQVEQAVAAVRRHRTVMLGMPRIRQPLRDIRPERSA